MGEFINQHWLSFIFILMYAAGIVVAPQAIGQPLKVWDRVVFGSAVACLVALLLWALSSFFAWVIRLGGV